MDVKHHVTYLLTEPESNALFFLQVCGALELFFETIAQIIKSIPEKIKSIPEKCLYSQEYNI